MPETLSGSKRLDWLRRQRDAATSDVETITSRAADEDRDLSDSEQSTCEARRSRITELDDQITVEADLAQRSATYQGLVSHIGTAPDHQERQAVERPQQAEPVYRSAGQYLVDVCLRNESTESKGRLERYLQRAVAHQTTAQNPGLLPVPILEPVFTQQSQRRPALEATTRRPLPGSGKTFQRPMITQTTQVGPQATEKTELPSRAMQVDPVTVTKSTYGGVINLSWQDRDWTDPSIMDLLVSDLAASYFQATDQAFCSYFNTGITQLEPVATPDGEGILAALYAASGTIYGALNAMPDTLWVSPDVWGALGSLVDASGRQMFPTVNPMNALGTMSPTSMSGSVAGINMVVDRFLPAGTAILGDSTYVESYETIGGQVSVTEPSVLGTQMAFYGYIAWLILDVRAFVKLTGVVVPLAAGPGNGETQNGGTYAATSSAKKAGS